MMGNTTVTNKPSTKDYAHGQNGVQHHGHRHDKNATLSNGASTDTPDTTNWLYDPLEALARPLGPYTVLDMEIYGDDYQIELYNGWLVWRAMGHIVERTVVSTIQTMLDISARKQGYGQALPDGAECRLDEGNDIIPDACLASWQRLREDIIEHGPNQRPLFSRCSELVVESRSESNTRKADAHKRSMYFAHGTLIVWDVDEEHKFIDVYRAESPTTPQHFTLEDMIDCEPLLPGWRRSVRDIFAKEVSAEAVAGEVAEEWREEGREEGIELGVAKVARNLLHAGMAIATVAQLTELSAEQVQAIQQQMSQE